MIASPLLAVAVAAGGTQAPPPPSAGFTAEALAAAPSATDTVAGRAERIRALFILSPATAGAQLDPMEVRAIERSVGSLQDGAGQVMLGWFMRGATVHAVERPSGFLAAYHNALADAALLVRVARLGGEWRILSSALVDGVALRGEAGAWPQALDPFAALARARRESVERLSASAADQVRSWLAEDGFDPVGLRIRDWLDSAAAWQHDAQRRAATDQLVAAIAEGRLAASRDDARARRIDALPDELRRTLALMGAMASAGGHTLFLISPVAPRLILLVQTDSAGAPQQLGLLDLDESPVREPAR